MLPPVLASAGRFQFFPSFRPHRHPWSSGPASRGPVGQHRWARTPRVPRHPPAWQPACLPAYLGVRPSLFPSLSLAPRCFAEIPCGLALEANVPQATRRCCVLPLDVTAAPFSTPFPSASPAWRGRRLPTRPSAEPNGARAGATAASATRFICQERAGKGTGARPFLPALGRRSALRPHERKSVLGGRGAVWKNQYGNGEGSLSPLAATAPRRRPGCFAGAVFHSLPSLPPSPRSAYFFFFFSSFLRNRRRRRGRARVLGLGHRDS